MMEKLRLIMIKSQVTGKAANMPFTNIYHLPTSVVFQPQVLPLDKASKSQTFCPISVLRVENSNTDLFRGHRVLTIIIDKTIKQELSDF